MRFDTLIRGGTIVTATDTYVGDVGIVGGKISGIGLNLPRGGCW
jgi:dihydropyrimidinase